MKNNSVTRLWNQQKPAAQLDSHHQYQPLIPLPTRSQQKGQQQSATVIG
ncbi:hypothetical protein GYH30_020514 [Glycine max]|nr:hypothetical protein GYH30_020514 [Glycine max]